MTSTPSHLEHRRVARKHHGMVLTTEMDEDSMQTVKAAMLADGVEKLVLVADHLFCMYDRCRLFKNGVCHVGSADPCLVFRQLRTGCVVYFWRTF